jgi:hypothetical protein
MLRSSNDLESTQGFNIKVKQRSDGRFEAMSPTVRTIPPTVANSSQIATAQHSDKLRRLVGEGKIR